MFIVKTFKLLLLFIAILILGIVFVSISPSPVMGQEHDFDVVPVASPRDFTSGAGRVTTLSGFLNVRSSPFESSPIIAMLANGSYVRLISRTDTWWRVEYDEGKYGYCSADFINYIPESFPAFVSTHYSNLNIRDGAGTNYDIIGKLPKGSDIIVIGRAGNWYWILYGGTNTGYCSADFIASSADQAFPAINISAQDFKQTDSRWSNVRLGNSSAVMSSSGCLVSCVAIVDTHRTGQTVLPDTLARTLSFTSDGSLYWPNRFILRNSSSGYLSVLYNSLKEGKLPIIGMRQPTGKQHWVVVTGYTGGNILVASNFTINDPGSSARKTLQHLINDYPIFHRIVIY